MSPTRTRITFFVLNFLDDETLQPFPPIPSNHCLQYGPLPNHLPTPYRLYLFFFLSDATLLPTRLFLAAIVSRCILSNTCCFTSPHSPFINYPHSPSTTSLGGFATHLFFSHPPIPALPPRPLHSNSLHY